MLGSHLLKAWSRTQPSISLSSGEAEYDGVVRAAGITMGQQSLMKDLGIKVGMRVWTGSSAAVGICGRSGLGKLRHAQTHTRLWIQECVRTGAIQLCEVNGLVNPADLFTKHLTSRDWVNQLVELFNWEYGDGRASIAPQLKKDALPVPDAHVASLDNDDDSNRGPAHDPDILPHNYDDSDLNNMFPRVVAPQDPDGVPTDQCICCRPSCVKCFPPQPLAPSQDGVWREIW